MKTAVRSLVVIACLAFPFLLRAASDPAAWKAADDARVAAFTSANKARLEATLSDELRYVHSNGKLDTKASMIEALTTGKSAYHSMTYESRDCREVAPGLVLMNGRVKVLLGKTEPHTDMLLSFLAVYRLEKGTWRFLAWQSCRLDAPAAAKK